MDANQQCCQECGTVRPRGATHFPRYKGQDLLCISCVGAKKRMRQEAKREAREAKMRSLETRAVDAMLEAAGKGGSNIPHSAELLETVMGHFGGVNGFSSLLLKQYFESKPGSATRTKMLEMITRLVTTNADQGGSRKPLQFWSEEELENELQGRLIEVAATVVPRLSHIPEVEHAAPADSPAGVEVLP